MVILGRTDLKIVNSRQCGVGYGRSFRKVFNRLEVSL